MEYHMSSTGPEMGHMKAEATCNDLKLESGRKCPHFRIDSLSAKVKKSRLMQNYNQ